MKCGSPENRGEAGEGWTSRREEYTRAFGVAEDHTEVTITKNFM